MSAQPAAPVPIVGAPGQAPQSESCGSLAAEEPARTLAAVAVEPPPRPIIPPTQRPIIAPLSPERFKLQVTISREAHDTLRQLQDLMRHTNPSGDAAQIVERALKVLLKEVLRRKCGIVDKPRRGDALQKLIADRVN